MYVWGGEEEEEVEEKEEDNEPRAERGGGRGEVGVRGHHRTKSKERKKGRK